MPEAPRFVVLIHAIEQLSDGAGPLGPHGSHNSERPCIMAVRFKFEALTVQTENGYGVQLASIVVTMAGCFGLMGGPFPMPTFFVAGALLYMGTIVLEALSMSLCSKARPLPNLVPSFFLWTSRMIKPGMPCVL